MRPHWHPLSTIMLPDPPVYATRGIVEVLLRSATGLELVYAGDRMWPALEDGDRFRVTPLGETVPAPGDSVLACPAGIPDVLRVAGVGEGKAWELRGDADPGEPSIVSAEEVLGVVDLPRVTCSGGRRALRRVLLDLREAVRGRAGSGEDDSAQSVRRKYDAQAPFYAASEVEEIAPRLLARMRRRLPAEGRILVAGSGSGRECLALAKCGWEVTGVDFSAEMVRRAEETAAREGVPVRYLNEDLRSHREAKRSLAGVLFTYDVYSFLPRRDDRIRLLESIREWLLPGGAVFLAARRVTRWYDRSVLTLQWLAGRREGRLWGDTHTRYIGPDGALRRSFVHAFTARGLDREAREAGLRAEGWSGGHGVWAPGR